jgi:hypothetical protein
MHLLLMYHAQEERNILTVWLLITIVIYTHGGLVIRESWVIISNGIIQTQPIKHYQKK